MPNVSLSSPMMPYDLLTQQAQLEAQQKLADLLYASTLTETPGMLDVGGGLRVSNFGEILGKRLDRNDAMKQAGDLSGKRSAIASALMDLYGRKAGEVVDQVSGAGGRGPDYAGGTRTALTSGIPELVKRGGEMLKGFPSPEEFLKSGHHYAPGSLQNFSQNLQPGALQPPNKVDVNAGVASWTNSNQPGVVVTAPSVQYSAPETNSDGVQTQRNSVTGQVSPVVQNAYPVARNLREKLTDEQMKLLGEGSKAARNSVTNLRTIGEAKQTLAGLDDNTLGAFAPFRLTLNKVKELFGARPTAQIPGAELLNAQLGQLVIEDIRKFAPVSDTDRKYVENIIGSLGLTKRGLQAVLDFAEKQNLHVLQTHEDLLSGIASQEGGAAAKAPGVFMPNFKVNAGPASAPPTVDDLLKKYPGQ